MNKPGWVAVDDSQNTGKMKQPDNSNREVLLIKNDQLVNHSTLGIKSDTIFAESKHRGMPPPGCTLPPQK